MTSLSAVNCLQLLVVPRFGAILRLALFFITFEYIGLGNKKAYLFLSEVRLIFRLLPVLFSITCR